MDFQFDESCNFTSFLQQNTQANVENPSFGMPNGATDGSSSKVAKPSNITTQETITLGDDCDEPSKENNSERPRGRKGAKARRKAFGDVFVILSYLKELKEEREKTRAEKIEKMKESNEKKSEFLQLEKLQLVEAQKANRIRREKLQMLQSRIENENLRLERDREDTNIMIKDLSSMDFQQQEYFKMRRLEILSRKGGNS